MYLVVFEGNGGPNSNYRGVRTFVDYGSQERFEAARKEFEVGSDEVLAQGVTMEEAEAIVRATPIAAYLHAAIDETLENSPDPEHPDWGYLQMKLMNVRMLDMYWED